MTTTKINRNELTATYLIVNNKGNCRPIVREKSTGKTIWSGEICRDADQACSHAGYKAEELCKR